MALSFRHALMLLTLSLFMGSPAQALIEFRGHYGLQVSKPDLQANLPAVSSLKGFGADVIVSPPFIPLAVGLRYETLSQEESNSYGLVKIDYNRVALLGGLRLIDTLIFLGPIASMGVTHGGNVKVQIPKGNTVYNEKNDVNLSYSVGVEGGVKLLGLLVGAEVGYLALKIKGSGTTQDAKLDGVYTKALIGFAF